MRSFRLTRAAVGASLGIGLFVASAAGQGTTRVDVDSSGAEANQGSYWGSLSADGRFVAFFSDSTNLVAGDKNGVTDAFVRDRAKGTTERVSVDSSGIEANDASLYATISADGNVVAFISGATNLVAGDTNGQWDVFVHDRSTGVTERVDVDSSGAEADLGCFAAPVLSADGRFVAFTSDATNLDPNDLNGITDVFVHDRATGQTERVSVSTTGRDGDDVSGWPSISADGNVVAYQSYATNLVPGDTNARPDIFVRDRAAGVTERISVGTHGVGANDYSYQPSISADGNLVAFDSYADNLVANDSNLRDDVFVRDRANLVTERVSVDSAGVEGNAESYEAAISADGTHVAFISYATNLVPGDVNATFDVFVHSPGLTELKSVDSAGAQANDVSAVPSLSADGQIVAFYGVATNLVANDTNGVSDLFVREPCTTPASWSNYDKGFAGSNGIPTFTSQGNPVLGGRVALDLGNSYGKDTNGLLFIGFKRTQMKTSWGGELLVVPALTLFLKIPASGMTFSSSLPNDLNLCGFAVDLQAIEIDPGAKKGVSFTQGLELMLGS